MDTDPKNPRRPSVRSRRLKGDTEKAQVVEKHAREKVSKEAVSGVSTGSKRKPGDVDPPLEVVDVGEPLSKRTKADQISVDVPFTSINRTQRLARVRYAVHEIYTGVDDDALIAMGSKEVNTLYESWLEETFQKASKVVNEHDTLTVTNTKLKESLEQVTIDRNASQKTVEDLQAKLNEAVKKHKTSRHKVKKVKAQLQQTQGEFLEHLKTTPEGLDYLGKMASASYRLATRETKQRLQAILFESNASLDWMAIEAEYDRRIATEQEAKAQAKKKGESSQTPGASGV
ncbi:hypothetical protein BVRB_9g205540 [Beta vulgaris subsp. vulgaris]|nr:hypothetical protein BVRB_9g205540 [Beta vulgaris subsp. vulgaris]